MSLSLFMQQPYLQSGIENMLGDGTSTNPYQIRTPSQLKQLSDWVAANNASYINKYYIQTSHLNLSGYANWVPIGNSSCIFSGSYDGNGLTISNLSCVADTAGLFGNSSGTLKNIYIQSGTIAGGAGANRCAGILAVSNGASITGCVNKASVVGNTTSAVSCYCGGIVGLVSATTTITDCYNDGAISHASTATGSYRIATGIARKNTSGDVTLTISRCLNTGAVTGVGSLDSLTIRQAVSSNATSATDCYYSDASVATQSGVTARTTANCQGTDALTDVNKLSLLGTTYWFPRITNYPLPIKFNR